MTYKELYEKAIWLLEHNEINGKEYDKMIEPLNAEVENAEPVRHGRWVEEVTDDGKGFPRTEYTCPFCQYKTRADTNYCPECGARMDEE